MPPWTFADVYGPRSAPPVATPEAAEFLAVRRSTVNQLIWDDERQPPGTDAEIRFLSDLAATSSPSRSRG